MSEKLKELLEKINQEGIKQAEEKARDIELKAKKDAERILGDARTKAEKMLEKAKEEAEKTKENTDMVLKQSFRDLTLSLKSEIKKLFNKVIAIETAQALSSKETADIIERLIESYLKNNGKTSDLKVLLKKEDLERLKKSFISKLKDKLKEGVEFKPSPNINCGFSISFDKGKSYIDFTEEGLAEALSAYLNPELAKLLKD